MPDRLVIEMAYTAVYWLNSFPGGSGISDTMSPREIVLRQGVDYAKHCRVEFGSYVQVHEEHDNSMLTRTTGALALRPTGNTQGGHFFFSLTSGRVLNRNHWTTLPMPQDVITRVNSMGGRNPTQLTFLDRLRQEIEEEAEEAAPDINPIDALLAGVYNYELQEPGDAEPYGHNEDANEENYDEENYEPDADGNYEHENEPGDELAELGDAEVAGPEYEPAPGDDAELEDEHEDEDAAQLEDENEDAAPPTEQEAIDAEFDKYGPRYAGRDMRPRRKVDYAHRHPDSHLFATTGKTTGQHGNTAGDEAEEVPLAPKPNYRSARDHAGPTVDPATAPTGAGVVHDLTPDDNIHASSKNANKKENHHGTVETVPSDEDAVLGFIFTQVSMKRGLKMFGDKGREAVETELHQLHDREVMTPVEADSLSQEEKKRALQYLMFLKEKRCGKIKGRGCADGRKQRLYTAKEDASSPTVAIESILLSCVIDAKEQRHVATADIPGAFMQADMDEVVHMRLEGTMVDLLLNVAPKYAIFVTIENGKKVLYVLLTKALYGTMRAALLFWRMLSAQLIEWGFTMNPYDPCVANKTVNGTQCTVLWHVDDLKISHVERKVVENVLGLLDKVFGKEAPLTVNHGMKHDYLGMQLDYSTKGKVMVTMFDYVEGMLAELPKDMEGIASSPAANHLFEVSDTPSPLDKPTSELFHHLTAKLLFLCKRARPDLQLAVAFLTTRVKGPDADDYKKLRRVMQYLRATKDMPFTLEADDTRVIKWWVDASFAVHPDMRGHTGGVMTLGKGAAYGTCGKHKLNTRSSTEAELVSLYDVLPQVIWTRNFLEAQGYQVKDSIVHQDNKSTILLAENGRASCSKRTRHLNIRYFFVTDRIRAGDLSIAHCPTGDMLADYFTKPLQGALFRKMRNLIMNVDPAAEGRWDHRSVLDLSD
jgi:Reverse transcriptase (RNA-dependent DNA polymerase)